MNRPDFITDEDISRWSENIDNDPNLPSYMASEPTIREVCYAGLWLSEKLSELNCPDIFIQRIQYTAGRLSFGRDIWQVHQDILENFKQNKLNYEVESSELN